MPPRSTSNQPRRPAPSSAAAARRTAIPIDSASPTPGPSTNTTTKNTTTSADQTTTNPNPNPINPNLTTATAAAAPRTRNAPTPSTTRAATTGPGVQRLQSLKKRTPTGSLVPLNADGTPPKPTLKYQPRAVVRKSKEERDKMERLEREREMERAREAAAVRGGGERGGRGRGRGAMGMRGRGGMRGMGDGSGPLGSGMSMRSRGGGGFGGGAGGGRFGGGGGGRKYGVVKAKREGGTGAGWVGGEGGGLEEDVSSDDGGVGGMRFSIEHINIVSDEEDGWGGGGEEEEEVKVKGKGKAKAKAAVGAGVNRGLRPIRVERQEHQERAVGVNTEASSGKSAELRKQAKAKAREKEGGEESLFVQDSEEGSEEEEDEPEVTAEKAVGRRRAGGTDAAADGEVRIKEEPTDDGDVLMTDAIPQATDDATTTADAGATKPKTKKTRASKKDKDPRSKLQTEEERQEWDRYEEDTEHIRHTLGTLATTQDKPPAAEGGEGQADKEEESKESVEEAPKDERSGRLFLIQFPPSTPNLVVPSLAADEEMNQDVIEADAHTQQQQQQQQPAIKQEAGSAVPVPSQPTPALAGKGSRNNISAPPLITAATNATLPPGRAGKLNIHRSGRATINWGGISFELTKGSDVEFLQDAIVASEGGKREEDESGMAVDERRVWAMSQVSGKFVVTPDWGELLG